MPACMHLRETCDHSRSFHALRRRLQSLQTMSPFFAHVIGTTAGEQAVVLGFGREYGLRQAEGGVLVQTNHFVQPDGGYLNPDPECESTYARFNVLTLRLKRQKPTSIKAGLQLLQHAPVTHGSTVQSMVLCPAAARIELLVRPNRRWAAEAWRCPHCHRDVHCFRGSGNYECPHSDCGCTFAI